MKEPRAIFNVLGTEWKLYIGNEHEFPYLSDIDGYTDKTGKFIVVCDRAEDCQLADFKLYQNKVIRHEVIHAYLFESGLHENMECEKSTNGGHPEQMVDWVAIQFPKILKTYQELGVL